MQEVLVVLQTVVAQLCLAEEGLLEDIQATNLPVRAAGNWYHLQVSWEDFQVFALLRQSVHRLAVALDFFISTEGRICKDDFQRAVTKIQGSPLPGILVWAPSLSSLGCKEVSPAVLPHICTIQFAVPCVTEHSLCRWTLFLQSMATSTGTCTTGTCCMPSASGRVR